MRNRRLGVELFCSQTHSTTGYNCVIRKLELFAFLNLNFVSRRCEDREEAAPEQLQPALALSLQPPPSGLWAAKHLPLRQGLHCYGALKHLLLI